MRGEDAAIRGSAAHDFLEADVDVRESTELRLPGLRSSDALRAPDSYPSIDGDTSIRQRDDGVEVELRNLREVLAEL